MQFDPNAFLDQETTQEAKRRPPIPVGDYVAVIGEVTTKMGTTQDGRPWLQAFIPLAISLPPAVKQELGYTSDTFTLTDRPFVDINDGGMIDWSPGRNRALMAYRVATGMNNPGEAFSLRRLQGRPVKVKVTHEMYEGNPQERIGGVTKP